MNHLKITEWIIQGISGTFNEFQFEIVLDSSSISLSNSLIFITCSLFRSRAGDSPTV